ncbi:MULTISPECIES: LLM class flavin-dependent oxidoreductase [Sphingomonas]|uniref:LLM class flavin-dependent oxidoreductase n=1 Tax=Sphingomonas TaxID=13687 RepID=UPI000DEF874F|nr:MULTISPECIES: LLM class flavin-dependent oxidoreductase [Sphingomonas]
MALLSVLDLSPVPQGSTPGDSLRRSGELAAYAERLGYHRYWMAEHHGMPGIASAATAVALAYVGSRTSTIRIGAGGIMLPNHAPLTIAEQFGTLEALYPGRVDLGLGRAPGTDQQTAWALRRNLNADENQFPNDVVELMGYFKGQNGRIRAIPGEGQMVPIWILGSSLFGAQLAAMLGLPYAFASHFAPQQMDAAIKLYRDRFEPSEQLDKPYVMLGFNAFVADSAEEAQLLATSVQQAFVALRSGTPGQLPPPQAGYLESLPMQHRLTMEQVLSCSAIGDPATARAQVDAFIERTQADELMVTAQIFDPEARKRSYDLLADTMNLSPATTTHLEHAA